MKMLDFHAWEGQNILQKIIPTSKTIFSQKNLSVASRFILRLVASDSVRLRPLHCVKSFTGPKTLLSFFTALEGLDSTRAADTF